MYLLKTIDEKLNNALSGLYRAFKNERSFLLHFAFEIPAIISGFILGFDRTEWMIIIITISMLLITELINTSIEFLVKLNTKKYNELAELLLNISAGAVLLSVITGIIIGLIIYIPYFVK